MAEEDVIQATIQVAGEAYFVARALIDEVLDTVPRLEVEIDRAEPLPKPATLLGTDVAFRVERTSDADSARHFVGVVTWAERSADARGRPFLKLVVEPKLFKLGKRTDCRTFQKKSVSDIAKDVIEGADAGPLKLKLDQSYEPRDYTVQYRETDLAFLFRICAEDGIALTFDHVSGEVVLFDDPKGVADAGDATLKFVPVFGNGLVPKSVGDLVKSFHITPDKVTVRDYDWKRPRFGLETTVEGKDDGGHDLEIYVFPARSNKDAEVKHRAQVLLDSFQCRRDMVSGHTSSLKLSPGERFTIEQHPYEPIDAEHLATEVHLEYVHERSASREARHFATVRFEAIPTKSSDYRPLRRPPRPVCGIQTAVTTGPPGEEIHVDGDGRVNVQFPWDRVGKKDDKSSVPMRTLQLATGGAMLLPRVGWEVIVHATEGDQDLPLVTGRVYNAEKPPPYALPANKNRSSIQTATTPGGGSSNEIRTDDTKGSEEMFMNASKDASTMAKNNATESVKANATLTIAANQDVNVTNSLEIVVGAAQSISVGGNQKHSVETFKVDECGGAHSLDVGGNRDMKVGGDHKHTVAASESLDVGGMKTDLVVGSVSETASGNMSLDVGAVRATLTVGNHTTTIGGSHTETTGAARVNLVFGTKSTTIGGSQSLNIGAAQVNLITGDRNETAGATLTEIATGAQIIKADKVVFEADTALTLVMGASVLSLTPASVAVVGLSIKLDGATADTAALIVDN